MNSQAKPVTVKILEKEYRIACNPGEEEEVFASARHLDERMREIRKSGKVIGTERIAVMAALNLAHELLSQADSHKNVSEDMDNRIKVLRDKIEIALNQSNQLEF